MRQRVFLQIANYTLFLDIIKWVLTVKMIEHNRFWDKLSDEEYFMKSVSLKFDKNFFVQLPYNIWI